MQLFAKVVEYFGVGAANLAHRHLGWLAGTAPPVLFGGIEVDFCSGVESFGAYFCRLVGVENTLPDFDTFVVTWGGLVTGKNRNVKFLGIQSDFFCQEFIHPGKLFSLEIIT